MLVMDNSEIAAALFGAFAKRDDQTVRNLCSPDLHARQNNGKPMDVATLLAFSAAVTGVVKDFRYCDPVRSATNTGFVEEHAVRGTLSSGKTFDLAICVVADVNDGKITDMREYFDTAAAAGLIAALK
jgi:ketosteroid isomerase-like protein